MSKEWIRQIPHRYDMPKVATADILEAIDETCGIYSFSSFRRSSIDLLDAIRQIIPSPSARDAKIAAYLMREDYESKDIAFICAAYRMSGTLDGCNALRVADRVPLAELLEKP